MIKKYLLFSLLFAFFFGCVNENNFENQNALFYLPTYNKDESGILELEYWKIKYTCANITDEVVIPAQQKCFCLNVCKNSVSSIQAFPVFKSNFDDSNFFYPAGCIYPFQYELSWLHGFTSSVLCDFYTHSIISGNKYDDIFSYINKFNWQKFIISIEDKNNYSDSTYNPWNLDKEIILNGISSGYFSSTYLIQKNCVDINFTDIKEIVLKDIENKNSKLIDSGDNSCLGLFVISSYVPENNCFNNFLNLKYDKENIVLCLFDTGIYFNSFISVKKDGKISLALNHLPI